MRLRFLFLAVIFCTSRCSSCLEGVPVLVMDSENFMSGVPDEARPLHQMSSTVFYDLIKKTIGEFEMVIIFTENELSVEDLSSRDINGTPFHNMRQRLLQRSVKYLPAVRSPYKTIASILPPQYKNTFYFKSPKTQLNLPKGTSYFYVNFVDEMGEERVDTLRRHDVIMESIYLSTRQACDGPILAIYTGKANPVVVESLTTTLRQDKSPKIIVESQGVWLSFEKFLVGGSARRHDTDFQPEVTHEDLTDKAVSTTISYMQYELQFNFSFRAQDWTLDSVGLLEEGEETGRTVMGVGAPLACSYRCAEPLVIVNERDGSAVSIANYKMQPFPKKRTKRSGDSQPGQQPDETTAAETSGSDETTITKNTVLDETPSAETTVLDETPSAETTVSGETTAAQAEKTTDSNKVGPTVDCGPYFSGSLLSGLAVVGLMVGTFLSAISMMMSIHTNDRYDNVNQKPLNIAAQT